MADEKSTETVTTEQATETPEAPKTPSVEELQKQIEALNNAINKQKKAIDSASADAADWKRKYRSTLDETARLEAERKEADEAKDRRIAELERKEVVAGYLKQAMAVGYDADLANMTAEAMVNGDMTKVFEGIGKLVEAVKTRTTTENLGKQPGLSPGKPLNPNDIVSAELAKIRRAAGLE